MCARIVVPLDGSETAELALDRALKLSREHSAEVLLVRVVDVAGTHSYTTFLALERTGLATALDAEEAEANAYLARVQHRLLDAGVPVVAVAPRGHAVQQIVNLVQPGDLVVMTTHGKGRAPRWFLGRVAEQVQRRCRVRVELVPTADMQPGDLGIHGTDAERGLEAW